MAEPPSGTVTLLFTDIEGSTRLLQRTGDAYADLLEQHRRLLRAAFVAHGGFEVDTEGDAFFVAFASANDAVAAAAEAQQALARHPWPNGNQIRVRVGIHTGQPRLIERNYVGIDVHHAARVMAAGHGGQVLVTRATAEAVDGLRLLELGEHRLKDFDEPVSLFQLGEQRFPPLKAISNTNLPRPASSFVGREREVAEVVDLIRNGAGLVTLTGPGGSGKTRLAVEAAAELVPEFKAGVFWVGLAALREPALVLETIAHTLGAKDAVAAHIGERQLLLLLDNIEQVIDAAAELAALVEACPNLVLLVTSRELLRVRGELEYEVLPLATPDALELFCARAQLEPSKAIAELCRRLDNMPLALELAASRARVLSPEQILTRLGQRLDLLKGARDVDPRQQTLRATIEWSYELLSPEEQHLFERLSVFAGGCTLEAAEEVCDVELDTLQSLVEKSLLRFANGRFLMLETIRQYAAERFADSGEAEAIKRRYVDRFVALAEEAEPRLEHRDQLCWLDRLEAEIDNLRAVLAWSLEGDDVRPGFRLCVALRRFWFFRDYLGEGQRWFDLARSRLTDLRDRLQAALVVRAGSHAVFAGDLELAGSLLEESLPVLRELGDEMLIAEALVHLGHVNLVRRSNQEEARACYEEALALYRKLGDPAGIMIGLASLGEYLRDHGDQEQARELLEEAAVLARSQGNLVRAAQALHSLGDLELDEEDFARAAEFYSESLELSRRFGFQRAIGDCLAGLACTASATGLESRAAFLWGAVEAIEQNIGNYLFEDELARYRPLLGDCCARNHEALERGRRLTLEDAVAVALAGTA